MGNGETRARPWASGPPWPFPQLEGVGRVFPSAGQALPAHRGLRRGPWGPSGPTAHRGTCPFPPLGRGGQIQQPGFWKEDMGGHEPSRRERKLPELEFPEDLSQASSTAGVTAWPAGLGRCQDRLQERPAGGQWGHCSELTRRHVPGGPSELWLQPQTRLGIGQRLVLSLPQPVFTRPGPRGRPAPATILPGPSVTPPASPSQKPTRVSGEYRPLS